MTNCKNHKTNSAIYKCSTCRAPICFSCYNEYLTIRGRKKLGFCSEVCLNKFNDSIKTYSKKHKSEAFGYLRKSFFSFSITLIFFIIFNPIILFLENGYSTGVKYLSYIILLQTGYGLKQLVNFISIYFDGNNPTFLGKDQENIRTRTKIHKPQSIKKTLKALDELDIKSIENYEAKTLLDEYKENPPYYVFSFGIPKNEILYSVYKFKKNQAPINAKSSMKLKIVICQIDQESTYIFFTPKLHPYLFYAFLSVMDSSNSVGFITKHDKTYMLKSEDNSDYIYGTTKDKENIEICIVDGEITNIKRNKYPYFETVPDNSKITDFSSIDLEIENIGKFGNPEFKIDT